MAKFHIELHGGEFGEGKKLAYYDTWEKDTITFTLGLKNRLKHEKIKMKDIESIQIASEEAIKKMGATFGWGLAGLALLGPLGMAAGLLGGGRSKVVTFIGILKDDRKFLASMNNKGFVKLQGAHMTNSI
jgi:hypothetical protein